MSECLLMGEDAWGLQRGSRQLGQEPLTQGEGEGAGLAGEVAGVGGPVPPSSCRRTSSLGSPLRGQLSPPHPTAASLPLERARVACCALLRPPCPRVVTPTRSMAMTFSKSEIPSRSASCPNGSLNKFAHTPSLPMWHAGACYCKIFCVSLCIPGCVVLAAYGHLIFSSGSVA